MLKSLNQQTIFVVDIVKINYYYKYSQEFAYGFTGIIKPEPKAIKPKTI